MRLLDKERKKKKDKMDTDDDDNSKNSGKSMNKTKEKVTDDLVVGTVFHFFYGIYFS